MGGQIIIRFWGTRGSIPTPGPNTVKYGGNTPCVEVRLSSGTLIIFDAGSGIRELGNHLSRLKKKIKAYIFFTHYHWDHIQGLPFFLPAYKAGNEFILYGCEDVEKSLEKIISDQMESVYFPIPLIAMGSTITFQHVGEGEYDIADFHLKTILVNHPGNTIGYRLTYGEKSIIYISDNELKKEWFKKGITQDGLIKKLIDFCADADLFIHDSNYTHEDYETHRGWGHSSYELVLKLAMLSGVKMYGIYHHDPNRHDKEIDKLVKNCRDFIKKKNIKLKCFASREGLEITL